MKEYNILVIFDPARENVLLCRRRKPPFAGLANFVGGKIEPGEDGLAAAYRELREETSLTREDVALTHFMDLAYYYGHPCRLEVYTGRLERAVEVKGDENELYWCSAAEEMFDPARYAGNGNMGHILEAIRQAGPELLG